MNVTIGIGLLGCGTVGANVAERLHREREAIERRSGVRYELRAVAIENSSKQRPDSLDCRLFTRDARSIVDDPRVDLIIELVGGVGEAAEFVERALDRGRHVVSANKDLFGTQGPRLAALAASRGAAVRFEAAVGGAIPMLRVLGEALAGDCVLSVAGVLNGTCTAILSSMEAEIDFDEALSRAQRYGYAESDPGSDLDADDSAHKLAIIAQTAFGLAVISPRIRRAGISTVTQRDVARARMLGLQIRLVAAAVRSDGGLRAEIAPVAVPEAHEFGRTQNVDNAVNIIARDAGRLALRGSGAGGVATASAVLGDVVAILRGLREGHDFGVRAKGDALRPAIDVEPFFERFRRVPELPQYPLWDDASVDSALRPAVNA
jgi:homoserine dehydrogenase